VASRAGALRVIVLGHIVCGPVGGMAWHHLQYVLGLAKLGHDAWFLEDSQDYPACYDPSRGVTDADPTYGLRFADRTFELVGLPGRFAYWDAHTTRWLGPAAGRAPELCRTADVLLHMSGKNPLRPWLAEIPHRVLVDTDPPFTQIRHLEDPESLARARTHTAFATFGENIATASSRVPDDGLPWRATRQPIVLDAWPLVSAPRSGALTTVMLWESYAPRVFGGVRYGMKSESFARFADLPQRAGPIFELAIGSPSTPKQELRAKGWTLLDPLEVARTAADYRAFLQRSRGEFGVAKHGYVEARTGWFSERSAAYLASGRPVVVQDTGFSSWLDADGGVLPFDDLSSAFARIEDLNRRYDHHCASARELAREYFDSDKVLTRLLADAIR